MRLPGLNFYCENENSRRLLRPATHDEFCKRISKTLYYGQQFKQDKGSLPLTSLAVDVFCKYGAKPSLEKLTLDRAASISREACISPCSLILAILYLERLALKNPEYLGRVSSSRLFLISVMVASKFMNDEGVEDEVFNDEWAASSGLDVSDVNEMERDFLSAIDWSLFVDSNSFDLFQLKIEQTVALRQSALNGFFTYTDVDVVADSAMLQKCWNLLAENVLKVAAVSLTAYAASVFTLVGSALLVGRLPLAMNRSSPALWEPTDFGLTQPFIPLIGQSDFESEELPPLDSTLPDSFTAFGGGFGSAYVRRNVTVDSLGTVFWDFLGLAHFEKQLVDPSLLKYKDIGDATGKGLVNLAGLMAIKV